MAFDTPENRQRYNVALTEHEKWLNENSRYGVSYTRGWNGDKCRMMTDDFEHWCAGRQNKRISHSKERDLDAERKVFERMIASQSEASQDYNRGKFRVEDKEPKDG